jgi:hypothetical protein
MPQPGLLIVVFAILPIAHRTEVPDQLVVLDPTLSAVDENYVRILQRYNVS